MVAYQQRVTQYYNAKVKSKVFHLGDLILRKTEVSKSLDQKKFSLNWEGPYKVTKTLLSNVYRLETLDGVTIFWT